MTPPNPSGEALPTAPRHAIRKSIRVEFMACTATNIDDLREWMGSHPEDWIIGKIVVKVGDSTSRYMSPADFVHEYDILPEGSESTPPPSEPGKYRADFLFGAGDESVEYAGYEFANAQTPEGQREWWDELVRRIKASEPGKVLLSEWEAVAREGRNIVHVLEAINGRAIAADGPVTPTMQEATDRELRLIYKAAKKIADLTRTKGGGNVSGS